MKKIFCVLCATLLLIACTSNPRTRISTGTGYTIHEDGKMTDAVLYDGTKLANARKIYGDCIQVVETDTGVKATGGPLCRASTIINTCTGHVIEHGACDKGTLQEATVYTLPAMAGMAGTLGSTAIAASASKAVARTMADGNVRAARARRPDQFTVDNGNTIDVAGSTAISSSSAQADANAETGDIDVEVINRNVQKMQQQQQLPVLPPPRSWKKPGGHQGNNPHGGGYHGKPKNRGGSQVQVMY